VKFAKANDNNITFFIHGYNVPVGEYAKAVEYSNSQYDVNTGDLLQESHWYTPSSWFRGKMTAVDDMQTSLPSFDDDTINYDIEHKNLSAGACAWNLSLEKNLNIAAGFSGDIKDYSRVVQIAWQGNPKSPTDYISAVPMADFAGEQLAKLIDKLKAKDIKVNIMAHSLGNAVLMSCLNKIKTPIDQAFCWEPAIGNDCFSNSENTKQVQNIASSYLDVDNKIQNTQNSYNVSYNYANAANNSKKFTIAYSNLDNILGPIPNIPGLFKDGEIKSLSNHQIAQRITAHLILSILSYYIAIDVDYAETKTIHQKIQDEGAGVVFGVIAAGVYCLDDLVTDKLGQSRKVMNSIYSLANRFVYPLSYFIEGDINTKCEKFYKQWQTNYTEFEYDKKSLLFVPKLTGDILSQNHSIKSAFKTNDSEVYEILDNTIDILSKYTTTGVLDVPQNIANNLWDTVSDVFERNPLATIFDTVTDIIAPVGQSVTSLFMSDEIQQLVRNIQNNKEALLTTVLTVLMTPKSEPATAMGYAGIEDPDFINTMKGRLFQTPQSVNTTNLDKGRQDEFPCQYFDTEKNKTELANYKDIPEIYKASSKSLLCVDHSAMLKPASQEMMDWVYRDALFGKSLKDGAFSFFGHYDMEKTKSNNDLSSKANKGDME
jgi:hypothetical protein